jgi:hypothetical protein
VQRVSRASRRPGQAGVSRAALLIAGSVVAAVLVLAAGALRSGPGPSASASSGPSGGFGSLGVSSLPASPTIAPTIETTPEPPELTPVPSLRGEYVGGLGFYSVCMLLFVRGESYELVLPDGYRLRQRDGRAVILDRDRMVIAGEGDIVGLNGEIGGGGSICMVGPTLHVTKFVDVLPRQPE